MFKKNFIWDIIYNEKTKEEFSDLFEMNFIELNKLNKDYKELKTSLDRWIGFLNRAYEIEKDKIPKKLAEDEDIKKAVEKLEIMYLDKEEREIYENDLKALLIHKAEMKTAEEKGREKENEQSRLKDVERVLKLLIKKFKTIDDNLEEKIKAASSENLNIIIEEILDIKDLMDVENLLKR